MAPPAAVFFTRLFATGSHTMPKPVIGISKRKFKIDDGAVFRVYGENLDDLDVPLKVKLESTNFDWDPYEYMAEDNDRKKHYVVVRSTPSAKAAAPAPGSAAPRAFTTTDDDVTITLTFDEGGPDEDVAEEDYDTTYEDP
jgi:hypothetical protein